MNARQKAKKLKKELAELKADRTNGFKWLKIDGISIKREEPRFWYDNNPLYIREPTTYVIQIGHTQIEVAPNYPDELIVIDSEKLDEAIRSRKRGDK